MTPRELFKKYTGLGNDYLNEAAKLMKELDEAAKSLKEIKDETAIVLYKKVENLKLEMVSNLTYYKTLVSKIECYREKGVFLEKFRKKSLSEHTQRLMMEGKITKTLADTQVRADEKYLADYDEIEKVREIMIIIWNTYELHMNVTIPTMTQIISTARKEIESEK